MATDGLDLLVNNAGGIPLGGSDPAHRGGFATIDDDAWQRTLDLNLLSAVRVTRALVDFLLRRRGVIINVSSEQHRRRAYVSAEDVSCSSSQRETSRQAADRRCPATEAAANGGVNMSEAGLFEVEVRP